MEKFKKYFRIFFFFFTLFFLLGMFKGWQRTKDPEYLREISLQYIQVAIDDKHYTIQYSCGSLAFEYDVDSNVLTRELGYDAVLLFNPWLRIPFDEEVAMGLLGGGTAGYSMHDIVRHTKKTSKNRFAEIGLAVIGALSGYEFGKWAMVRSYEPECGGGNLIKLLEIKPFWKDLEKRLWMAKYTSTSLGLSRVKADLVEMGHDKAFSQAMVSFESASRNAKTVGYDFKSSDFAAVDKMKRIVALLLRERRSDGRHTAK